MMIVSLYIDCFFFFFKQKTAYEMRISDWSSDVCSSDLNSGGFARLRRAGLLPAVKAASICGLHVKRVGAPSQPPTSRAEGLRSCEPDSRSEEHTSELQSLMRISYAVFCLKKKKNRQNHKHNNNTYSDASV